MSWPELIFYGTGDDPKGTFCFADNPHIPQSAAILGRRRLRK
jgi:hypothetical protein